MFVHENSTQINTPIGEDEAGREGEDKCYVGGGFLERERERMYVKESVFSVYIRNFWLKHFFFNFFNYFKFYIYVFPGF